MIIATLGAIAHGAGMPVLLLVFGNMSQKFINYASISYVYISCATFLFYFCSLISWMSILAAVYNIHYLDIGLQLTVKNNKSYK